jgi:MOSC domain-containing protein YiiM
MRGDVEPATVVSIHIAGEAQGQMRSVPEVRAVVGRGLEGDRYFRGEGTYSGNPGDGRDVTLIEIEAIEALEREYDLKLDPGAARRNIVTRGVRLNDLVGHQFSVGEVTLRGVRLCEPCAHLARLTDRRALPGLVHGGGLRADIVRGGVIRAGDPIHF